MSHNYTKGCWIAVGFWVEHEDDNVPDICNCDPGSMGQEGRDATEVEANARLIAAAPQMFEALRSILLQINQGKVLERDACIQDARIAYLRALHGG